MSIKKSDESELENLDPDAATDEIDEVVSGAEEEYAADDTIPDDKDEKPARKKVAALKARHALEEYFELKKIKHELDYLIEEEKAKEKAKKTKEAKETKETGEIKEKNQAQTKTKK
jgi:hypothetical protein